MESLKRLGTVLWAPTETFRKIGERPTWAAPLIVLLLIGGGVSWLALQRIDVDAQRQMLRDTFEERQGLRGEELDRQVDRAMEMNAKLAPFTPVIGVVFSIGAYALLAVIFMVALRLAGGELGYVASFATTLYGLIPFAVSGLIALPILLGQGSVDPERLQSGSLLASNLAVLAPEDAPRTLVSLLASFDLFTLWAVILLVIGYSVVARVSKGVATAVVVGAWVAWIGIKVGLAALFS
jgi:hypothetical protein